MYYPNIEINLKKVARVIFAISELEYVKVKLFLCTS